MRHLDAVIRGLARAFMGRRYAEEDIQQARALAETAHDPCARASGDSGRRTEMIGVRVRDDDLFHVAKPRPLEASTAASSSIEPACSVPGSTTVTGGSTGRSN